MAKLFVIAALFLSICTTASGEDMTIIREFARPDYTYRVTVDRVIDGDTIDVLIDVGFKTTVFKRLRLLNVDTEELRDKDPERRAKAQEAKAFLEDTLNGADRVYVQTFLDSTGKYGRLLAWVWVEVEEENELINVNELLFEGFQKTPK